MPKTREVCTCGHLNFEHKDGGSGPCEACNCKGFVIANAPPTSTCSECHGPSDHEICETCAKAITDNCPGDLLDYLFGIKGDISPRVGRDTLTRTKAKKLALEIRDAGLDIQTLWDHYQNK